MKANWVVLLVLLFSTIALADTLQDPRVLIDTGGGTTFLTQPIFSFSLSDPNVCTEVSITPLPTWDCPFRNVSGTPWTSLDLIISPPQTPLSCQALAFFGSCQASGEGFLVSFSGGSIPTGVCETEDDQGEDGPTWKAPLHPHHPPSGDDDGEDEGCTGQDFVLEFQGFSPDTGITGEANVPEPGTLALLGSGIVGLIARRKKTS